MLKLFSVILLVIVLILIMPFAYIWALNTLFPSLNIPYMFDTWLAMLLAHGFFHVTVGRK